MALTSDYMAALQCLAAVFETYRGEAGSEAVLVGGAAVAILTNGLFPSGDFDVVAARDDDFARAMLKHGFRHEDRPGHLRVGFYHPDHPCFGFQQVSGALFDGQADRQRLIKIEVTPSQTVALPSIEDMIADRLAQHAVSSPTDDSRLRQAKVLFALFGDLDERYLLERIRFEGGEAELLGLKATK